MENNPQKLAERIANILYEGENEANDFTSLRKSVEQIGERLSRIENNLSLSAPHSALRIPYSFHPSQEKFEIAEAVAHAENDRENLEGEKPCPFEPTGKPCDHCSMCSSRGF